MLLNLIEHLINLTLCIITAILPFWYLVGLSWFSRNCPSQFWANFWRYLCLESDPLSYFSWAHGSFLLIRFLFIWKSTVTFAHVVWWHHILLSSQNNLTFSHSINFWLKFRYIPPQWHDLFFSALFWPIAQSATSVARKNSSLLSLLCRNRLLIPKAIIHFYF